MYFSRMAVIIFIQMDRNFFILTWPAKSPREPPESVECYLNYKAKEVKENLFHLTYYACFCSKIKMIIIIAFTYSYNAYQICVSAIFISSETFFFLTAVYVM